MEANNDRGMPPTATGIRVIVLLLVSICLSTAIGLAMLITALAPASVAARRSISSHRAVSPLFRPRVSRPVPTAQSRSRHRRAAYGGPSDNGRQ